jgi:hypothetical protein
MKAFTLILISFLIDLVLGASFCNIAYSNNTNVTTFEDCKAYTTSSSDKFCCYVNGADKKENPISSCAELTGTVRGALKDLNDLEGALSTMRYYYLKADCHLDKEISICHPDDKKSYSPLSADYCSKYSVVETVTGVDDKSKCCYVSGISVDKKNVYSCIGIDNNFYTIDERKNEIENGDFKRLGALTDIKIECSIANFYSISIISLLLSILFI